MTENRIEVSNWDDFEVLGHELRKVSCKHCGWVCESHELIFSIETDSPCRDDIKIKCPKCKCEVK